MSKSNVESIDILCFMEQRDNIQKHFRNQFWKVLTLAQSPDQEGNALLILKSDLAQTLSDYQEIDAWVDALVSMRQWEGIELSSEADYLVEVMTAQSCNWLNTGTADPYQTLMDFLAGKAYIDCWQEGMGEYRWRLPARVVMMDHVSLLNYAGSVFRYDILNRHLAPRLVARDGAPRRYLEIRHAIVELGDPQ